MKQTAVEWLIENSHIIPKTRLNKRELIEQAKEMEKQQIIDNLKTLLFDISQGKDVENIEQYYNETFKQQEK